jgi:hypothetical protein
LKRPVKNSLKITPSMASVQIVPNIHQPQLARRLISTIGV